MATCQVHAATPLTEMLAQNQEWLAMVEESLHGL